MGETYTLSRLHCNVCEQVYILAMRCAYRRYSSPPCHRLSFSVFLSLSFSVGVDYYSVGRCRQIDHSLFFFDTGTMQSTPSPSSSSSSRSSATSG